MATKPYWQRWVNALKTLLREIDDWQEQEGESPDAEPDAPEPIELGHDLHDAIEQVQRFYRTVRHPKGILPREGLDGGARQASKDMLRYSRESDKRAYAAGDRLRVWAVNELKRVQRNKPKDDGQKGRGPSYDPEADRKVCLDWQAAKRSGTRTVADFCRDRGLDEAEFRAALDRHRKRLNPRQ